MHPLVFFAILRTAIAVRIRDRRLGLTYGLFLAGIIAYVVGWVVLGQKGYMYRGAATGVVRLGVRLAATARAETNDLRSTAIPNRARLAASPPPPQVASPPLTAQKEYNELPYCTALEENICSPFPSGASMQRACVVAGFRRL